MIFVDFAKILEFIQHFIIWGELFSTNHAFHVRYPNLGVIIHIVSKEDITYRVAIGNIPHCTGLDFTKMSSHALGKKEEMGVLQTSL